MKERRRERRREKSWLKWGLLFMLSLLIALPAAGTRQAQAAEDTQQVYTENANTFDDATSISTGKTYSKQLTEKEDYKFTLSESGTIVLSSTFYGESLTWSVYGVTETSHYQISYKDTYDRDSGASAGTMSETYYLMAGTYVLTAECDDYPLTFSFKVKFTSAKETCAETYEDNNNTFADADNISLGTTYKGQMAENEVYDYYKFKLSTSGKITLDVSTQLKYLSCSIYDVNTEYVDGLAFEYGSCTGTGTDACDVYLTSGTYYIRMYPSIYGFGNYSFKLSFTSAGESFTETYGGNNNSIEDADSVSLNKKYKGQLASNDENDYYKFTVKKDNCITLIITMDTTISTYWIYDKDGNTVAYAGLDEEFERTFTLSSGTYYLRLHRTPTRGGCHYSFKLTSGFTKSNVTLSKTSFTYTGKKKTPSITVTNAAGTTLKKGTDYTLTWSSSSRKSIGKYTVTIKGKGDYAGSTVKKTFKIKPAKVTLKSSTKSSSSKKLTVKWSKVSGSVKYQIAYKVKGGSWKYKTVSAKTYSKTLTGLKSGKTYYVKVRAYKSVSGTKYYGSWSSTKKVKVK